MQTYFRTLLLSALLFFNITAKATTLDYAVSQITSGGLSNEWQLNFTLTGNFSAGEGFDIYFDPSLYQNLQNETTSDPSSWSVFTIQPDSILPANGSFTATALVDTTATNNTSFSVDVNWLGASGQPGLLPFDHFDSSFNILETGQTQLATPTSTVPLPPTFGLMMLSLLPLLIRRTQRT